MKRLKNVNNGDLSISQSKKSKITKINNDIKDINNITNKVDLTDKYQILYAVHGKYIAFSGTHWIFTKVTS